MKIAFSHLFLTLPGTATALFLNRYATTRVKQCLQPVTQHPTEHVLVILMKDLILSRTLYISVTAIPQLKIVPVILVLIETTKRPGRKVK